MLRVRLGLLAVVPIGFLGVFFAWPVAAVVGRGFSSGGVATAVADGETWKLAGFTVAQAAASTVLAVLAGLPVAFLLARVQLPGIALVRTLVLVLFVLSALPGDLRTSPLLVARRRW
jgi:thiamine transport system permease protein